MPVLASQAAKLTENAFSISEPSHAIMRANRFVFGISGTHSWPVIFSYRKKLILSVRSKTPSTAANDNCQLGSNNSVGLVSSSIIAANESELKGFGRR